MKYLILGSIFFVSIGWYNSQITNPNSCARFSTNNFSIPDCINGDYELVFEDNFDGNELDTSIWEIDQGPKGNSGIWEPNNVIVNNGTLKLLLKKESGTYFSSSHPFGFNYDYTLAEIKTKNSNFFHGKYEIRCRILDPSTGAWPAYWLQAGYVSEVSGVDVPDEHTYREMDMFEMYYDRNETGHRNEFDYEVSTHYDYLGLNNGDWQRCTESKVLDDYDLTQWHTFTCYFEETKITCYIDGDFITEIYRYKNGLGFNVECGDDPNSVHDLFSWARQEMHLYLDIAIDEGNFPSQGSDPIYPCTYEVDYVKYYQKSDCSQHTYAPLIGVGGGANWTWIPLFTGWNVDILDDAVMESSEHSQLIANTSIETLGNFEVELGANFEAWIDPTLCNLYKSAELTTDLEPETQEMLSRSLNLEINFEINYENQIYPNPFTSELMLEIADEFLGGEYKVYDMLGNLVRTGRLTSNLTSINGLDQLTSGIYSIVISKEDKVEVQKVMKN